MTERTRIGAGDDRDKASTRVENLLSGELANPTAFAAMATTARLELMRRAIVLLLRIAKRVLKGT
jgi:hypothetical protein